MSFPFSCILRKGFPGQSWPSWSFSFPLVKLTTQVCNPIKQIQYIPWNSTTTTITTSFSTSTSNWQLHERQLLEFLHSNLSKHKLVVNREQQKTKWKIPLLSIYLSIYYTVHWSIQRKSKSGIDQYTPAPIIPVLFLLCRKVAPFKRMMTALTESQNVIVNQYLHRPDYQ